MPLIAALTFQIDYHSPEEGHKNALTTSEEDPTADDKIQHDEGREQKLIKAAVLCVVTPVKGRDGVHNNINHTNCDQFWLRMLLLTRHLVTVVDDRRSNCLGINMVTPYGIRKHVL